MVKEKLKENGTEVKEFMKIENKATTVSTPDPSIMANYGLLISECIQFHIEEKKKEIQKKGLSGFDWDYQEEIIRLNAYFKDVKKEYFEIPLLDARKIKDMVETARLSFIQEDALTFRYYIKNLEIK